MEVQLFHPIALTRRLQGTRSLPEAPQSRFRRGAAGFSLQLLILTATNGAGAGRALPLNFAGSTTIGAEIDPLWSSAWFSHAIDRRHGLGVSVQLLPSGSAGEDSSRSSQQSKPGERTFVQVQTTRQQAAQSFTLLEWIHLLQRWNLPAAQANLWLFGGVGAYSSSGASEQRIRNEERLITTGTRQPQRMARDQPVDRAERGHVQPPSQPASSGDGLSARSLPQAKRRGSTPSGQGLLDPVVVLRDRTVSNQAADPALRLAASPGLQFDIETTRLRLEGRGRLFLAPGVQRSLLSATAGVGLTPPRYQGIQPWLELQVRALPGVIDGVELIPKLRLLQRRLVLEAGYSSHGTLVGGFTFTL